MPLPFQSGNIDATDVVLDANLLGLGAPASAENGYGVPSFFNEGVNNTGLSPLPTIQQSVNSSLGVGVPGGSNPEGIGTSSDPSLGSFLNSGNVDTGGAISAINNLPGQAIDATTSAITKAIKPFSDALANFPSLGQIGIIIVGFIFVVAGLALFKPSQDIIETIRRE